MWGDGRLSGNTIWHNIWYVSQQKDKWWLGRSSVSLDFCQTTRLPGRLFSFFCVVTVSLVGGGDNGALEENLIQPLSSALCLAHPTYCPHCILAHKYCKCKWDIRALSSCTPNMSACILMAFYIGHINLHLSPPEDRALYWPQSIPCAPGLQLVNELEEGRGRSVNHSHIVTQHKPLWDEPSHIGSGRTICHLQVGFNLSKMTTTH